MLNDENDCIRYLMKEMDPSEEVLMERAMMEDDDLLIEVESLRQTLRRLDELPEKNPPSHLTESILKQASEQAEKSKTSILSFQPVRYAAAAVLILGVSVGSLWVYQDTDSDDANRENLQASEMVAPVNILPSQKVNTEPWVDNQNVLYFHDQFNEGSTEFDSIMKESTNKLRPLNNPFYYSTGSRSIQMTGSGVQQ